MCLPLSLYCHDSNMISCFETRNTVFDQVFCLRIVLVRTAGFALDTRLLARKPAVVSLRTSNLTVAKLGSRPNTHKFKTINQSLLRTRLFPSSSCVTGCLQRVFCYAYVIDVSWLQKRFAYCTRTLAGYLAT